MFTTLLRAPQIFWSCDGPILVLIRLKYRLDSDIVMLVTVKSRLQSHPKTWFINKKLVSIISYTFEYINDFQKK